MIRCKIKHGNEYLINTRARASRVRAIYKLCMDKPTFFLQALADLEDDYNLDNALRIIHQQDVFISYLVHQLQGYDSLLQKHEKLLKRCDFLRKQNKRLLQRNKDLVDNVYKPKNHR